MPNLLKTIRNIIRLAFQLCSLWLERRRNKAVGLANKLIVHYLYRVTGKEKCPACGSRAKHEYKFNPAYRAVIHRCKVCVAEWGQKPLVIADQWMLVPQQQQPQTPRGPVGHYDA
jgi:hypothetical protein